MGKLDGLIKFFTKPPLPMRQILNQATSPRYLVRLDSRPPAAVAAQQGFPATPFNLESLTSMHLTLHQLGDCPLGLGANLTLQELRDGFLKIHPEASERTLYGFSENAFYLKYIIAKLGRTEMSFTDSDGRYDMEQEYIVQQHVPLERFLFATTSKHRDSFNHGLRVPNELFEFNPMLPKVLTQEDIKDLPSTIGWLLEHNAEIPARDLVKSVCAGIQGEYLLPMLKGRKEIAEEVNRLLLTDSPTLSDKDIYDGPRS